MYSRCRGSGAVRPCYWTSEPIEKSEVLGLDQTNSGREAGNLYVQGLAR
jgi:hypothetical protein